MPKCGGSSTLATLKGVSLLPIVRDYNSFFRLEPEARRHMIDERIADPVRGPRFRVVYGHFFPVKYLGPVNSQDGREQKGKSSLVTILRDPADRLLSHYHYWQRINDPGHWVFDKMIAENWTFEDFALSTEMRNFYSQWFEGIDIASFSYIGMVENFDNSLRNCLGELGLRSNFGKAPRENMAKSLAPEIPASLRRKIVDHHSLDYEIIEQVRERWPLNSD
jgi:hypothetical protein